jgi:hypothetical protein
MCDSKESSLFLHVKENSKNIELPGTDWTMILQNHCIAFIRSEDDLATFLIVTLDVNMHVKVYHRNKELTWMQWDSPTSETDVSKMLKILNESIVPFSKLKLYSKN